jgi:hypothetical protein
MKNKIPHQRFVYLPLANIEPSNYQRPTNPKQVDNIVQYFDEAKLGTMTVSKRDNKTAIIDGAHRLAALRRLEYTHAVCEVLTGLTLEQEAEYFAKQGQDKRALRPFDLYKAGLIAGDEKCLRIEETLKANDFRIGFAAKDFFQIGAIRALSDIVDDYGYDTLDETLMLISDTWYGMPKATHGDCLLGVAEFIHRFGLAVDFVAFSESLRHRLSAIWQEYRDATRMGRYSISARKVFCRVLVDNYNNAFGAKSKMRLVWED